MRHIRGDGHQTRWRQYAKNAFPGAVDGDDVPDLAFFISTKLAEDNLADVQQAFEAQQQRTRNGGGEASDAADSEGSDREDHFSFLDDADPGQISS